MTQWSVDTMPVKGHMGPAAVTCSSHIVCTSRTVGKFRKGKLLVSRVCYKDHIALHWLGDLEITIFKPKSLCPANFPMCNCALWPHRHQRVHCTHRGDKLKKILWWGRRHNMNEYIVLHVLAFIVIQNDCLLANGNINDWWLEKYEQLRHSKAARDEEQCTDWGRF